MTQIKKVKTSEGVQFYPQTHTKAVIDDNGYTAESRLGAMQDEINQAQMAIGAVPSDLAPTENSSNWVTSGGVFKALKPVKDELYDKVADDETISIANTETFTTSRYIYLSDGSLSSGGSTWRATIDYIPIGDNWWKVRIGSIGGIVSAAAVAFYREDKSYISGSPCGTATTVDIPADAKYVRFSKANDSNVHTIITYHTVSKIGALGDEIDGIKEDLKTNYRKKDKEEDYSDSIKSGLAYYGTVGSAIQSRSNASFKSVKIACEKGTMFKINAAGYGNAHHITVIDSSNIVLGIVDFGINIVGGVFEVPWDNAVYFYLSAGTISTIIKLPTLHDDSYVVNNAANGMYAITGSINTYTNYKGIGVPFLLKKGDVVKITGKSYQNCRAYLLMSLSGTYIGSFSDTDAYLTDIYYTYMGEADVFLYVNGYTSQDVRIEKLSKDAAMTLRWRTRKMVAMGDSITSYDASDFGEYIRGTLGCPWCSTNQPDWGNLAEGNATICNWENTTDTFTHDSAAVGGTHVNRTLPNEVLQLLQHVTAEGEQITWTIKSDNSTHSIDTSVAVGTGYTSDIPSLIVIAMGTNDSNTTDDYSTVISQSYSNLTKLTICSALRWSLETLQNKFPSASIVCVTPIKRGTRTTAEMEAKCALIKKICNYMAIPVVDGYNISGFSPLSYGIYSSDQIHPNSYSQRVARSIAAQVNTLA